jgi:hypothetical protein
MALDKRDREHVHREEIDFRRTTRRNKLFGLWAAGELGLEGEAAESYAKAVVAAELDRAGGLIRKVTSDFEAQGKTASADELHKKLDDCMIEARRQIGAA